MNIVKELTSIWNFYRSDVKDQKERNLLRSRLYNLIGTVLTPVLTVLTLHQAETFNLIFSVVIFFSFFSQLVLSYLKVEWYKTKADKTLYYSFFFYIFYCLTDSYYKNFSVDSTFIYVVVLFAIVMVLSTPKRVQLFLAFNLVVAVPYIILTDNLIIRKELLLAFFVVFYAISLIVIRGRYETGKRLIDRENFLKALFNQSYDAFLLVNFYSKEIIDCNNVAVQLFELNHKSEILGSKRDKFKVNPFTTEEAAQVKQSLQQNGSWTSEQEYFTQKGRKFPANVVITTLSVDKSNYYVVRITDISKDKESKEKLRVSEEKYRNLFERNLAGVYKVRVHDKLLLDCNNAFAHMLGYSSRKEIIGEICSNLYKESSDNNEFHNWIKEKKQILNHESKITLKTGEIMWAIENTTLVDNTDEDDYVEGTMIDISELKEIQQTLQNNEEDRNLLLNSLNVVVYTLRVTNSERFIEYISPQVEQVFGYTKEEYNSKKMELTDYYHTDDLEVVSHQMEQMKKTKQPITLTYRFNNIKTVKEVWIEESIFPQFDNQGNHVANFGVAQDVTERIKKDEELKESEQRFKQLSNLAIEGILFTENRKVIDANDQFIKILGYDSIDEILGKDLFDFISPESSEYVKEYINAENEKNDFYLGIGLKKDGSKIFLESTGRYIAYGDRKIRASVINDVDEKIRKTNELKESEQRFKLLAEASQEGIVIHDQGVILEVNDLLCRLVGYSKDELIGKTTFEFVNEINRDDVVDKVKKGVTEPYQAIVNRKDQTSFFCEVQAREIPYKGKLVRVASIRDITQKLKAEKELNRSRERFKEIVENSPDGIIIHEGSQALYANKAALDIMGISSFEDFIKQPYLKYIHPKYQEKAKNRMFRAESGEKLDFEPTILIRPDNSKLNVESRPLRMNIGDKSMVLVVLHDISERVQLEKEQLRAELAEETNKRLNIEISERLKVQEKLIEAQQYTQSIIESSLDIICATDEKGIITEFNSAAQRAFGYTKEEIVGEHVSLLYTSSEEREATVSELFDGSGYFTGEVVNIRKDGAEFISYLAASVLKNKMGQTTGLMGVSRDITEVKKSQILLEKSEEKYRDLFENSTDLIQSVDSSGKILFVNESWKKTLGYSDDEIKGMNIFDIIAPSSRKYYKEALSRMFNGEQFDQLEIKFLTKKKKKIIVEGNVSCKYNETGNPISSRGIFRDVTTSRKARRSLIDKEQRLSAIINNTEHIILSIDLNYKLIEWNKAFSDAVYSMHKKKLKQGLALMDVAPPQNKERYLDIYKIVEQGNYHFETFEYKSTKGELTYEEVHFTPIFNEINVVEGIAIFSQDITDRKIKEQEIKHALDEKEVLLKEVHHRVKNNLQVISSILNLQTSYVSDENTLQILEESQNRIKSMSFIHESLYQTKDFSSIDFQDYILNLSNNLIHSYQIYSYLVDLKMDVDKVLLNLDQAIPCGLIVNELISNALKYAFKDGDSGEVKIQLKQKEKQNLQLIVEDNGKGLPEGFDFRNAESLGLQLVTSLVDQIDGKIECEVTTGTKFIIDFKKL